MSSNRISLNDFKQVLKLFNFRIYLFLLAITLTVIGTLAQIKASFLLRDVFDTISGFGALEHCRKFILLIILLFLLRAVLNFFSTFFMNLWRETNLAHAQKKLFDHIQKLELIYHLRHPSGYFLSCILYDIMVIQNHLANFYMATFKEIPTFIFLFCGMMLLNRNVALLSLSFLPLLLLLNALLSSLFKQKTEEVQKNTTEIYEHLEETLNGIHTIKALRGEQRNRDIFSLTLSRYVKSMTGLSCLSAMQSNTNLLFTASIVPVILLLSSYGLISHTTTGDVIAFSILLGSMLGSLNSIFGLITDLRAVTAPLRRVKEVLDFKEEPDGSKEKKRFESLFEFKDVYFSYDGCGSSFELKNINLKIKRGEKIAIVGPSGSGKTTLIKLMLKLLRPTRGEIFLDSVPLCELNTRDLRGLIMYVPQETFLFSSTIFDNIVFPKESLNINRVIYATQEAGIYEKISALPNGFFEICGRNGLALSGGERQRIALSRIFVNDGFEILVLDEAFREVDAILEKQILEKIFNHCKDKTLVCVTHRMGTVTSFDRILLLKGGEIVCEGSHNFLLETCEIYREMFLKSTGGIVHVVDTCDSKYGSKT